MQNLFDFRHFCYFVESKIIYVYDKSQTNERNSLIDLVTVFDAFLTSRQTREKLQCLYENLMSNNFGKTRTAVLKKNMNCKLKLHSKGFY